jgi:uncharacterized protein (TIGR02284 family)
MDMKNTDTTTIDALNSFLRGEMAAVETYEQAIAKISDPYVRQQLEECQRSHQMRVDILREEVEDLGGDPADSSGGWGAFANAWEGGAKIFGEEAAIAALERGEDHGLAQYRRDLDKLDFDVRDLVEGDLLPEQERTHAILSSLKQEH